MKLVDILARELKVWPDGVRIITQQGSGYLFDGGNYPLDINVEVAENGSIATVTRAQWQAAVDELKAENCAHLWVGWSDTEACELCNKTRKIYVDWDGAGSPPIGALVQDHSDIGGPVYMAEVVSVEDRLVAIKRPGSLKVVDAHALRPVRTPEQIAADERMNSAKVFHSLVCPEGKWHKLDDVARESWATIYDAGFRKFEIVDN